MRWRKRGILLSPLGVEPWAVTHAAVPHVAVRSASEATLYFTTRDELRRSHIATAALRADGDGLKIGEISDEPVLRPGVRGTFDDSGVMTSCLVRHEGTEYLYYQGWELGVTVPFYVFVGCAVRTDPGGAFERVPASPVLGRNEIDPFMCSSPWVLVENGVWRMWYVSNVGWTGGAGTAGQYRVHVKYAESNDGISWTRDGRVCIDFASPEEYAISRPVVVRDADRYRMWYSHRGESYRIGYAESEDGLVWTRLDAEAGIDVSDAAWETDMVEYACVFDLGGHRHMLYNGNGFGASGIAHATLEL